MRMESMHVLVAISDVSMDSFITVNFNSETVLGLCMLAHIKQENTINLPPK